MGRLGREDTGIDDTAHAVEKILGNTGTIALDDITGSHALGGDDICLLVGGILVEKRNVGAATRIILDSLDRMGTGQETMKVDGPYPPLGTTSVMSDSNLTSVVATTLGHTFLGEGQWKEWPALP